MREFRRKTVQAGKLDMTPLLDVMFMLLLFFLLTSSFLNPSIKLQLPHASNKDKLKKQDIIISIDMENNVYLNREKVNLSDLESKLKSRLISKEKQRIIFRGDERIPYKKFVKVMDIIKKSGAKEINLSHESR